MVVGKGQLLVWEWQSESYVFKQQGHFNNMASLAYSPDGQHIVTGGDDGKVSPIITSVFTNRTMVSLIFFFPKNGVMKCHFPT